MALPKIDKLSSEFEVSKNDSNEIKQEIVKLGKSIQESSSLGLKAATQAVVGNVPSMIKDLTDDIKSGSINNFATAMNKLITLTEDLGINLREYNSELADTVERFTGNQAKLQEELNKLREQGIRAEIDEDKQRVKILTQNDIIEYNSATSKWNVAFDASDPDSTQHYVTNLNTGIQYRWDGTEWKKSYEGIYSQGNWSIVLDGGADPGYNSSLDATTP